MNEYYNPPSVKEMIEELKKIDPNAKVYFGGLEFYRLHSKDGNAHFEFNQGIFIEDNKVVVENHQDVLPIRE